jgi:hypothetical protein
MTKDTKATEGAPSPPPPPPPPRPDENLIGLIEKGAKPSNERR